MMAVMPKKPAFPGLAALLWTRRAIFSLQITATIVFVASMDDLALSPLSPARAMRATLVMVVMLLELGFSTPEVLLLTPMIISSSQTV